MARRAGEAGEGDDGHGRGDGHGFRPRVTAVSNRSQKVPFFPPVFPKSPMIFKGSGRGDGQGLQTGRGSEGE